MDFAQFFYIYQNNRNITISSLYYSFTNRIMRNLWNMSEIHLEIYFSFFWQEHLKRKSLEEAPTDQTEANGSAVLSPSNIVFETSLWAEEKEIGAPFFNNKEKCYWKGLFELNKHELQISKYLHQNNFNLIFLFLSLFLLQFAAFSCITFEIEIIQKMYLCCHLKSICPSKR